MGAEARRAVLPGQLAAAMTSDGAKR